MSDSINGQQGLDLDDQKEFERCLANYLAGIAEEDELRRLERWISESDDAREEYLRQSEAEAMLQWQHGQIKEPIEFKPSAPASVLSRPESRSSRRPSWHLLGVCAAVLTIVFAAWWNRGQQPVQPLSVEVQLAANWSVRSTPGARYTVVARDQLELEQGELFVMSSSSDQSLPPLKIETPFGNVSSGEGTFYVGAYPKQEDQSRPSLTRVLVVGGAVKLTNKLGNVDGNASELITATPDSSPEVLALRSNNKFALELYKKIRGTQGNLFVSPYSISQSLLLALEGARGETAEEIGRLLHFPEVARRTGLISEELPWQTSLLHTGAAQIRERMSSKNNAEVKRKRNRIAILKEKIDQVNVQLRKLESERKWKELFDLSRGIQKTVKEHNELVAQIDQYELRVGNAMWVEKEYDLNVDFKETVERFYTQGAIFPADFRNRSEEVREEINRWAAKQTNNRIPNVLPPDSLESSTAMVLANAIYFRGKWVQPFETFRTKDAPFTLGDNTIVKVPLMHAPNLRACRFGAFHADGTFYDTPRLVPRNEQVQTNPGPNGFSIVELPYKGDEVQMLLLAPNDPTKLTDVEALLSEANLERWNRELKKRATHVFLPRFELDKETNLNSILQEMGMRRAFRSPATQDGADFSGVSSSSNEMFVSTVRHKAILQVNEEGTEAAAVTVMDAADSAAPQKMVPFTPTFRADRPFCFLIRNKATGTILFMGRYVDPAEQN